VEREEAIGGFGARWREWMQSPAFGRGWIHQHGALLWPTLTGSRPTRRSSPPTSSFSRPRGLQCRVHMSGSGSKKRLWCARYGRRSREVAVPRGDPRRQPNCLLDLTDFSAASAQVRRRQQEKATATTRRAPRRNLRQWDLPQEASEPT
jgi:hypothetical protein